MEFVGYLFKLLILTAFVILLLYGTIKLNQKNIIMGKNKRYLNVLERVNINKDNSFIVLKIGEEGCVISTSSTSSTKIKDLTKEEIKSIEDMQIKNIENLKNSELCELLKLKNKIIEKVRFIYGNINR